MVPCPAQVPARPTPLGVLPDLAEDALRVVSAKLLEYAGKGGYADKAEDAIKLCTSAEAATPSQSGSTIPWRSTRGGSSAVPGCPRPPLRSPDRAPASGL